MADAAVRALSRLRQDYDVGVPRRELRPYLGRLLRLFGRVE